MKAIILAAGEGKRLMPYTAGIPKCMVKLNGRPLINYQIEILKKSGIKEIIIVKGCHDDKINLKGIKTITNKRYFETNMVHSLFCAESELNGEVIVAYGDIVYSSYILEKLIKSNYDISVVIDIDWKKYWEERFDDPLDDAESLKLDVQGRIIEIGKSVRSYNEINGQYIGLMKFSSEGIKSLKNVYNKAKRSRYIQGKIINNAYMTDLLQTIIDEGIHIWPVNINGNWIEVDTVKDLKLATTKNRLRLITVPNT